MTMADNVRNTLKVIRFSKLNKLPALILALDFEKVFDSVTFNYIIQLLQNMNFEEKFMQAMKAIYNKLMARVKINYARSAPISIKGGTRQDCPFSLLLFALCIKPLANQK